jgi:hypothetical protein
MTDPCQSLPYSLHKSSTHLAYKQIGEAPRRFPMITELHLAYDSAVSPGRLTFGNSESSKEFSKPFPRKHTQGSHLSFLAAETPPPVSRLGRVGVKICEAALHSGVKWPQSLAVLPAGFRCSFNQVREWTMTEILGHI